MFFWAFVISVGFAGFYAGLGEMLISVLTNIQEVQQTATDYLVWVALLPLVSVWSFGFDGIYLGATRTSQMRNTMLLSTFVVFLPAWFSLQTANNHGLWLAFFLFMCGRAISMAWVYLKLQRQAGFML